MSIDNNRKFDKTDPQLFNNLIWLDSNEASEYLRISVGALRTKISRGEIPFYKFGRSLRFKKSELDTLMESSKNLGGFYER